MSKHNKKLAKMTREMNDLLNQAGYDMAARELLKSRFEEGRLTPEDEVALDVIRGVFQVVFSEHNTLIQLDETTYAPVEQVLDVLQHRRRR